VVALGLAEAAAVVAALVLAAEEAVAAGQNESVEH
jgi:hypothetical protein